MFHKQSGTPDMLWICRCAWCCAVLRAIAVELQSAQALCWQLQVSIAKQLKGILGIEDSTKIGFLVHVSLS